ncbi:MAG: DUF2169 domain-containing protein [Byssovorax sp.]
MDIYSLCPLRVGTLLWEAHPEQLTLTVTVKATFDLVHGGEATLAAEQEGIGDDRHWDNNALGSLHRPGDNAPLKPKVDIVFAGHACAPGGAAVTTLTARLRVGDLVKSLRVSGDRLFSDESGHLAPGAPMPFTRMPLRYERALMSADNPVGVDPHAPPVLGALAFPNIEPEGRAGIAGFGPIAPTWRSRRKLLDDASLFWAYGIAAEGRVSTGPAPPGFNFAFFNTAPQDQQLDLLRGGAPIELDNLHPSRPRIETHLPMLRPQVFRVHPRTGRAEEIVLRCDTLWIDGDRCVAVQSFRGLCDLGPRSEAEPGILVVAADPQGKKLRFEKVEEQVRAELGVELRAARPAARVPVAMGEADPLSLRHDAVKTSPAPSTPEPKTLLQQPAEAPAAPPPLPPREERSERTQDISQLPRPKVRKATLPFQDDGTNTSPALPFTQPQALPQPQAPAPPPLPPRAPKRPSTAPPPPPIAPPAFVAPPAMIDEESTNTQVDDPETVTAAGFQAKAPAPPPLLGANRPPIPAPPKVPVLGQSRLPESPPAIPTLLSEGALAEAARAAEAQIASRPAPVEVKAPVEPAADLPTDPGATSPDSITLDQFASISAELSRKGADRAAVLKRHGLTIASWGAVDRRHNKTMSEHAERGDRSLQASFDAAYVAAQGRLGKPIGVPEYARILVGLEKGEVGRVLHELELQLSDLMRLQRVWTKKLADTPKLAAELSRATEEARKG